MNSRIRAAALVILVAMVAASCSQPGPAGPQGVSANTGAEPARAPRVKHVNAAMMGQPANFVARVSATQISLPGANNLEQLVNATMVEEDGDGRLSPLLAEAVPSLENGLWTLSPDGKMETTWRIRPGVTWHDGTPLTSDDFLFTWAISQDREIPLLRFTWQNFVEEMRAPDARTVTIAWSRPFIDADRAFTERYLTPLPKHLLDETYQADKSRFTSLRYWSEEFVGTGPFKVRQFQPGSSIVLEANDHFALGRPKIDEIEIRFILDLNPLMTSLLAGSVDLVVGRSFSVEEAVQLRDQWSAGRVEYWTNRWIVTYPQFINPTPAVVADLQFRRALMHATDRQQLVDTIQGGLGGVAHSFFPPSSPEFAEVGGSVVRYDYDPRRAAQMIEGLGFGKNASGAFVTASGEPLSVELRSTGDPAADKAIFVVADEWSRIGLPTQPLLVPMQRIADREYGATFPAFRMIRQPLEQADLARLHGSVIPLPENGYVGANYARYSDPEFDRLLDRVQATIPVAERMQTLKLVVRYISEQLNAMGMFYDLDFLFSSNNLKNVGAQSTRIWKVQDWEMTN